MPSKIDARTNPWTIEAFVSFTEQRLAKLAAEHPERAERQLASEARAQAQHAACLPNARAIGKAMEAFFAAEALEAAAEEALEVAMTNSRKAAERLQALLGEPAEAIFDDFGVTCRDDDGAVVFPDVKSMGPEAATAYCLDARWRGWAYPEERSASDARA